MKVFPWIQKHLVTSILISMFTGFIIGLYRDTRPLQFMTMILTLFMVYPMMVTLNYQSLLKRGNPKLQITVQLINFLYLPLLAYIFGIIFFPENIHYRLGILLIALLPTSGMTVSWTVMAKGNVSEAIRMIVIGLMLGGLLTPFFIRFYLGASVSVSFGDIFYQIILIVFIPMLLGFLTQRGLIKVFSEEKFKSQFKPIFPYISTLALLLLLMLVMSFRAQLLFNNPLILVELLVPITLGYLVMLFSVHMIGIKFFNRNDRIALVNGTMIRSLSLALAIALSVFTESGPVIAMVIALAYIVQVQLAAWYVRKMQKTL